MASEPDALLQLPEPIEGLTSIIVLSCNGLDYTRMCLENLYRT